MAAFRGEWDGERPEVVVDGEDDARLRRLLGRQLDARRRVEQGDGAAASELDRRADRLGSDLHGWVSSRSTYIRFAVHVGLLVFTR